MAEIESDPESKAAKEYYKKLSDLEKKNPSKRKAPGSILIKNMKGGRVLSTQNIELNEDGNPLTGEELTLKKKYIDFASTTFPEVNPIDMVLPDYKGSG